MKVTSINYRSGYRVSLDYNSVEGMIEATAHIELGETEQEAFATLRKRVRSLLAKDYEDAQKLLHGISANMKSQN